MSDISLAIVKNSLVIFNILGTFGNLNIILATLKNKELRQKCGILLAFLAFCDLMCLWNELQSYFRLTFEIYETKLKTCFWANIFYIFMEPLEVYVILAIGIDRILAISCPFEYRTWKLGKYLPVIISPGILFGLLFMIISYFNLTNTKVELCVLPLAMPYKVSEWWNKYNMWGAILTTVLYIVTYVKLYLFNPFRDDEKQSRKHKVILSTLIVQVIVFFFSSVLSASIIMFVRMWSEEAATDAEFLAVIPGLISYSCNFYVYFWRSMEYRRIFMRQIFFGHAFVKLEPTVISVSTASRTSKSFSKSVF